MAYTAIDLFSGAGGLTAGFVQEGFEPVLAVEKDAEAAATYAVNHGTHVVCTAIESIPDAKFPRVDVVMGGPPCQGFSALGRMQRRGSAVELNGLWHEYARGVLAARPSVFLLENVPQFLRSAEYAAFRDMMELQGFTVLGTLMNALDYGVPQKRKRAIVIGSRIGPPRLPPATALFPSTVRDAIGELPRPKGNGDRLGADRIASDLELHFRRRPRPLSRQRYRLIPPGGNRFDLQARAPELTPRCWREKPSGSSDVFGRLRWDEPAVTIRTEFWKPEKGRYLHPRQHRGLTHLEGALLQGFPRSYRWTGRKIEVARQIGNAVPPPLAAALAGEVRRLLDGTRDLDAG